MNHFEKLQAILSDAENDFAAFYGKGNKAAGTRVRKAMQELKNLAQEVRQDVTAKKNA